MSRGKSSSWAIGLCCIAGVTAAACQAVADDWSRFRGPNGSGITTATNMVEEFGADKNLIWQVSANPGTSSPIVVSGKLFYTSHKDDVRTLHCLDAENGAELWTKNVTKQRDEVATPPNDPATPTPACDGKRVVAFFPDYGLVAFALDGEPMWTKEYPASESMHGLASSPVIVEDKVIHQVDQLKDSFLVAYHADSGEVIWKVPRVSGVTGGYSTPAVYRPSDEQTQLIVSSPMELAAFRADTGEKVWWVTGKSNAPISSPVVLKDRIYYCEPVGDPIPFSMVSSADKDKDGKLTIEEVSNQEAVKRLLQRIDSSGNNDSAVDEAEWDATFGAFEGRGGLVAVDPSGVGDVTSTHVEWTSTKSLPHIPCALVEGDFLYLVQDGGIVTTYNRSSGESAKRARLKSATGKYYASPIAADGKVFLANTKGAITVLAAGGEWEVLATNQLGEGCFATPAIWNDRLIVRTEKSIFCFGDLPNAE